MNELKTGQISRSRHGLRQDPLPHWRVEPVEPHQLVPAVASPDDGRDHRPADLILRFARQVRIFQMGFQSFAQSIQ